MDNIIKVINPIMIDQEDMKSKFERQIKENGVGYVYFICSTAKSPIFGCIRELKNYADDKGYMFKCCKFLVGEEYKDNLYFVGISDGITKDITRLKPIALEELGRRHIVVNNVGDNEPIIFSSLYSAIQLVEEGNACSDLSFVGLENDKALALTINIMHGIVESEDLSSLAYYEDDHDGFVEVFFGICEPGREEMLKKEMKLPKGAVSFENVNVGENNFGSNYAQLIRDSAKHLIADMNK